MDIVVLKSRRIDRAFSPPLLAPFPFPGALPQGGIERAFGAECVKVLIDSNRIQSLMEIVQQVAPILDADRYAHERIRDSIAALVLVAHF